MDSYFDADTLIGEAIGDWHLEAPLGEGGMSFIFQGTHASSGMQGAVKLLRPEFCQDQQTVMRFEQEARLAGQLQHDNIVKVLDFGRDEQRGWYYMVLELLRGVDLGTVMPKAPFPKRWIASLTQQICSALAAAHREGIIHRDLKPSNIFLLPNKPFPQVKLLDFGVAKLIYQKIEMQITQAGEIIGTPAYVAPEQFSPKEPLTHSADVYAMGVLLFQLFTGRLPIDGGSAIAHAVMVLQQEAPLLGRYRSEFADTEMERLIERLLSKQASSRPADMDETWQLFCEVAQVLSDPIDLAANVPDVEALVAEVQGDNVPSPEPTGEHDPGEETIVMPEGAGQTEAGETTFMVTAALVAPEFIESSSHQHLAEALSGLAPGETAVDRKRATSSPDTALEIQAAPPTDFLPTLETNRAKDDNVESIAADPGEMTMMDVELPVVVGEDFANTIERTDVGALLEEELAKETVRDRGGSLVEQVRAQASQLVLSRAEEQPWSSTSQAPVELEAPNKPISLQPVGAPATWVNDPSVFPLPSGPGKPTSPTPPKRAMVPPVVWGFLVVVGGAALLLWAAWLAVRYWV